MSSEDKDPQDPVREDPNGEETRAGGSAENARESEAADADATTPSASDDDPQSTSYYDDPHGDESEHHHDDPHAHGDARNSSQSDDSRPDQPPGRAGTTAPPPSPPPTDDEDEDEEGMARMSFLEHLEELRTRILRALGGLLVVYVGCLAFAKDLLEFVLLPFYSATESLVTATGDPIKIINIRPLEQFQVVYIKVPIVTAVFVGAPWLMYQAWKFIAPGLYKKEKRWAVPFIFTTASLFILGGVFCYFIALQVTLQFLLTVASPGLVEPQIAVSEYLNLFIILEIGLGIVFQLPVLIFFFTLMRLTTPRFLLRNVRYAVLIMFIIAAIITPTGDPLTMTLFAGPMILLYFVGIGASWLLVLKREGRTLPWLRISLALLVFFAGIAAILAYMYFYQGYRILPEFPWFGVP